MSKQPALGVEESHLGFRRGDAVKFSIQGAWFNGWLIGWELEGPFIISPILRVGKEGKLLRVAAEHVQKRELSCQQKGRSKAE